MTATLTTLRDRVERKLADNSNAIWSTDDIDEAIRAALQEYSLSRPQELITTLTLASTGREISVSGVTGLIKALEIWVPYTAASPEWPPNIRPFKFWQDSDKILVTGDYEPQANDVLRIFYTKMQTLNGLDSEITTTFPDTDESTLLTGASGYAATSRAVDLMEKVTLDRLTAASIRAWGLNQLQEFRIGLKKIERALALAASSRAEQPPLDRWDTVSRSGAKWA